LVTKPLIQSGVRGELVMNLPNFIKRYDKVEKAAEELQTELAAALNKQGQKFRHFRREMNQFAGIPAVKLVIPGIQAEARKLVSH
jgi:hypothetical protein